MNKQNNISFTGPRLRQILFVVLALDCVCASADPLTDRVAAAFNHENPKLQATIESDDGLIDLGYVSRTRNLGAKSTSPYRYRISDPAFAFYYEFVSHNEAALERTAPSYFWRHVIEPRFDTYLGRIFERVAEQAYQWLQPHLRLPVVQEWDGSRPQQHPSSTHSCTHYLPDLH